MKHALFLSFILALFLFLGCNSKEQTPDTTPPIDQEAESASAQDQGTPSAHDALYPPAPNLPQALDTIHIAVISDINGSYGSTQYQANVHAAVKDIVRRKADLVLCPGDMVAGQKKGLDYKAMWRAFHFAVDDVLFDNGIEFVFAPGNHDASSYSGYEKERAAYAKAWESRRPKSPLLEGSHYPFWYGVIFRDILILVLDVTRAYDLTDEQISWLETTLRQHPNVRQKIVMGHLPIVPIRPAQFFDIVGNPRFLDILLEQKVNFYISGHHHVYYPGHIQELRTISSPALGANPRAFYRNELPKNAYVWIELPPEGPARVQAFIAPDYTQSVDLQTLPPHIFENEREDLGMANYIIELLDREQTLKP